MHLSLLVVSQRILLQLVYHHLVGNDHIIRPSRFNHEFKDIEQLAGITTTISQQGTLLLQFNMLFPQFHILRNGTVQQSFQIFLFQRFQDIELTSGEQRPDDFERRILRCSTNQGNDSFFYRSQERILLTLGESVNLIYK